MTGNGTPFCPDCEADPSLGAPSRARWIGPDGGLYCSLHLTRKFGTSVVLARVPDYQPPERVKPPAPKEA